MIVLDTYTKLMFQNKPFTETEDDNFKNDFNHGRSLIWKDASSYCNWLWYGGYYDWFLPNKLEAYSYDNAFQNSSTLNNQNRHHDTSSLTSCARKVK